MLHRDTLHHGPIEVNADIEFIHPTVDEMNTIIPFSERWKCVLVQASGGLDSTLLLYLLAKNLARINSKVQILPLSLDVPTKVKNLSSARAIIERIRQLTGYQHLLAGLEVHIPMELAVPPFKDRFFNDTIYNLFTSNKIDFEFNGNTKNPPAEIRTAFRDDESRQIVRDNRTTIYNGRQSASPHAFVNKKGIVNLYRQENLINNLASLTLSCDMDAKEIEARGLPVPCGECWWCRERAWGFQANALTEQAPPGLELS